MQDFTTPKKQLGGTSLFFLQAQPGRWVSVGLLVSLRGVFHDNGSTSSDWNRDMWSGYRWHSFFSHTDTDKALGQRRLEQLDAVMAARGMPKNASKDVTLGVSCVFKKRFC